MATKQKDLERERAKASLLESLKPGDRVYTILKHVSRSGMYRVISVVKPTDDGMLWLSWNVARRPGSDGTRSTRESGWAGSGWIWDSPWSMN